MVPNRKFQIKITNKVKINKLNINRDFNDNINIPTEKEIEIENLKISKEKILSKNIFN